MIIPRTYARVSKHHPNGSTMAIGKRLNRNQHNVDNDNFPLKAQRYTLVYCHPCISSLKTYIVPVGTMPCSTTTSV